MIKKISIGESKITILPVIKGLTTESVKVKKFYEKIRPDAITLSISPEELEALKNFKHTKEEIPPLSRYEEIYANNLQQFGKVELPSPCYMEALKLSNEKKGTPILAIDMNDEEFTDAYCAYVTGFDLFRHSIREGWIRRKKFRAKSAEEFVKEWDSRINNLKGFRKLEQRREEHMSKEIQSLSKDYKNIFALIELERASGVAEKLQKIR